MRRLLIDTRKPAPGAGAGKPTLQTLALSDGTRFDAKLQPERLRPILIVRFRLLGQGLDDSADGFVDFGLVGAAAEG